MFDRTASAWQRLGRWRTILFSLGAIAVVILGLLWAGTPAMVRSGFDPTQVPLDLELVSRDFREPLHVTHAPGDASRLFVVEKPGTIRIVRNGTVQAQPFLDLTGQVSTGFEQGLLSLAFHPNFANNRYFYINYTDRGGQTVVARYRVAGDNPDQADPDSRRVVLQISQPAANHNGGMLAFGPDGYLYIGTGDGGRGGDPWGNAQDPQTLLGKMLRIDVDAEDAPYRIPTDNPFVGDPEVRDEIWAVGLRNPWRYTFDRVTGDLYIADVGQSAWEEINFQPADSAGGENYGWNIMEGTHCYPPGSNCSSAGLTMPVAEYENTRAIGCSVTGGYVYRGEAIPELAGSYLFGDYCSGHIWALWRNTAGEWHYEQVLQTNLRISSFGEDATGEIYVADLQNGVYRLVSGP